MVDGEEYSPGIGTEHFGYISSKKKSKNNNKRRFNDEQIKSLESMFESETRLEPRKKLQVARELGLQPRQVAIWFQNKRARWKSKQLERDYNILQSNYDNLASRFESLKKEKQALLIQLQKMNDGVKKTEVEESEFENEELKTNRLSLDDDDSKKAEIFGVDMISKMPDSPLITTSEDWGSLDTSNGYQWWDFWS